MKIFFLINGFGNGGAEKQCILLLNELQKDPAFDVHLIHFFEGVNFSNLTTDKITIHKIEFKSLYDFANVKKLSKIIEAEKPNVIFSWLHACDVYSFFLKMRHPRVKWVMAERDSSYPLDPRYLLRAAVGRFSNAIVANSAAGKRYWTRKMVPESRVSVIPNILQPVKDSVPQELTGSPIFMYAGRLEPQKNVIHLTKVFCNLSAILDNATFYIIGEGSLKDEIAQLIASAKRPNQIILLPFQKNIGSYFKACDAFVSLSLHEGLPNTVIENISLGNLIFVSDIQEHRDILGDDYPYYVSASASVEEAVKSLTSVDFNSQNRGALAFGQEKLKEMNAQNIISRYKKIFLSV